MPAVAEEPTDAGRAPPVARPRLATGGSRPAVRRVSGTRGAVRPSAPAAAAAAVAGRAEEDAPDSDATQIRSIDELERARAVRSVELPPDAPFGTPETLLADIKAFIGGLGTADKLAFIGSALTVLMAFFPWKETRDDGEVIGLLSLGLPAVLAAVVTMVAVGARDQRSLPGFSPALLWMGQLGSVCVSLIWCLVFIKLSWDSQEVPALIGNENVVALSRPAMGVYLSLVTEAIALAGTLMGVKERPA